jgi:ankyrin repeat protein
LRLGADHTITERDGYNPPHGVAFQGRPEAARALIRHKVPVDVPHADGFTPLHRTVWGGKPHHVLTAKILVSEGGANVNRLDAEGYTPAHRALEAQWVEMLNALIILGADPNIQTPLAGNTLLHGAVTAQSVEIVKLVIEAGGDITIANKKGETSKELAAQLPSAEIQALLNEASGRRRSEIFGGGGAEKEKEKKEEL